MKPKIAICFFGITRSLTYTIKSINENILTPAREVGEVEVFCHFYDQGNISNPRSGESGALSTDEYKLLNPNWHELEAPNDCLEKYNIEFIKSFGDFWDDSFYSFTNLIHQLHSVKRVTNAALESDADIFILVRPDLEYHDSFSKVFKRIVNDKPFIFIPNWQHWEGGYNDRFTICSKDLARKYGSRIDLIENFCSNLNRPLHSENLVKYCLRNEKVNFTGIRASRVRANGLKKEENFLNYKIKNIRSFKGWKRIFANYFPPKGYHS